jgi:hypothetical protein
MTNNDFDEDSSDNEEMPDLAQIQITASTPTTSNAPSITVASPLSD